jgi:hypothetical protein
MTTRTLTSLYDNYDDAAQAVRQLQAADVPPVNISMMASNADNRYPPTDPANSESASGAGTGASIGTVIGGGAGLLAGLGMLAIPGVGPVVAAG